MLFEYVRNKLAEADVNVQATDYVRRLGKKKGGNQVRPVLVELSSQRSKKEFFDKAKEIKDKLGITLANDCSKNKREDYNKLKEIQKSLKNEGIECFPERSCRR